DSRKFTVARLAPQKYGDHISHNVKGAGSSNFQPQILIQCSSAGDDEGYLELHATSEAAGGPPQQRNGNSLPGTVLNEVSRGDNPGEPNRQNLLTVGRRRSLSFFRQSAWRVAMFFARTGDRVQEKVETDTAHERQRVARRLFVAAAEERIIVDKRTSPLFDKR